MSKKHEFGKLKIPKGTILVGGGYLDAYTLASKERYGDDSSLPKHPRKRLPASKR